MPPIGPAAGPDYAIVVGITRYPYLDPLNSPENDARAFHSWLTRPAAEGGGGIDSTSDRARLVLSSQFAAGFAQGMDPPTVAQVEAELIRLQDMADANQQKGLGKRVGRRLYLYFSGHGCAPRFEEAAILMANATRRRVYHLTGMPCADWFYRAGTFEEVVLLMDCCRERYEKVGTYVPPWVDLLDPEVVDRSKRFYGLAAEWSKVARSVFTLALLAGLEGGAYDPATVFADPANGTQRAHVTAASLKNYLYNHMKDFLPEADLGAPGVSAQPDIPHPRDPNAPMVFCTVAVPVYPVTFRLPVGASGQTLRVVELKEDGSEQVWLQQAVAGTEVQTNLPRNNYIVQVSGMGFAKGFPVKPLTTEGANVVTL
jgi:Caspase domain